MASSPIHRQSITLHELGWPKPINWYAAVRPATGKPLRSFPPFRYGPIKAHGQLEAYEKIKEALKPHAVVLIEVVNTAEWLRTRYTWCYVLEDWMPDRERNDLPPGRHPQGGKAPSL